MSTGQKFLLMAFWEFLMALFGWVTESLVWFLVGGTLVSGLALALSFPMVYDRVPVLRGWEFRIHRRRRQVAITKPPALGDSATEREDSSVIEGLRVLYQAHSEPARELAQVLWTQQLRGELRAKGGAHSWGAELANGWIMYSSDIADQTLRQALEPQSEKTSEEVQRLFGDYFKWYQRLKDLIHQADDLVDLDLFDRPGYVERRKAHDRFLLYLAEEKARSGRNILADIVKGVGPGVPLRDPGPRAG